NNTLAGNNALLGGGGIYAENSGNTKIRNTVIYGNSAGLGFVNGLPKLTYSFVEGRSDVTNGNIAGSVDPQFTESNPYADAPFITGNYILKATSPIADKGDNSFYLTGSAPDLSTITTDVLGNTRFYNTTVDMGAFEYQPGALPLKLISFEALFKNNAVNVSWQTMDEVNVSHFEIERSMNGISFVEIGIQKADGKAVYDFTDTNLPPGNIYYRLKIQDKDGQTEFSTVKMVRALNFGVLEINTYPVPSNSLVYIANKNKRLIKGLFSVLSTSGKTVMQTYSNPVDIHSLVQGMYYIRIVDVTGKLIGTRSIIKY
ncbi:MAG: choice-of-anchor Q domain-containing protein, partial [Ginsengibacter sp.]